MVIVTFLEKDEVFSYANEISSKISENIVNETEIYSQYLINRYNERVKELETKISLQNNIQDYTNNSIINNPLLLAGGIGSSDTNYADDKAYQVFKEGTYFPKVSSSQIIFFADFNYVGLHSNYLDFTVNCEEDTYPRTLYIYLDGTQIYSQWLSCLSSQNIVVDLGEGGGNHKITIEIAWGAYKEHGWLLEEAVIERPHIEPQAPSQMYLPKLSSNYARSETYFIGGQDIEAEVIVSENGNERWDRYLQYYVDGVYKGQKYLYDGQDNFYTLNLGSYSERTVHLLELKIYSIYGLSWYLSDILITWGATLVEVQWMQGEEPLNQDLEYIETYYKQNGYERIEFDKTVEVATDNSVDGDDLINYMENSYYYYTGITNYRYILFGKYAKNGGLGFMRTWKTGDDYNFSLDSFIAMKALADKWWRNDNKYKVVIMHELGHTFTILKITGGSEYYDWHSISSVMNTLNSYNNRNEPYYSKFYWDGGYQQQNSWNLREDFSSQGSKDESLVDV